MIDLSGLDSRGLLGRWVRTPLAWIPDGTVVPVLQGPLRGRRWVVGASIHGCWLGWYERPKQERFVRHVRPGDVVYDLGANVGFYTLLASRAAGPHGRVVAFEPVPRNLDFLRRHIELNRCDNVVVRPTAVGAADGTATFDADGDPSMGRLSEGGGLTVRVEGLDSLLHRGELPPPDLMKVDVEGAEASVFRGAQRLISRYRPVIFLATHGTAARAECLDLLAAHGYSVDGVDGPLRDDDDEMIARPAAAAVAGGGFT